MTPTNRTIEVPNGQLATVVTFLEMRSRPKARPESGETPAVLRHVERPDVPWYRDLNRRVGEDYLWFMSRLVDDEALRAVIQDDCVELYALDVAGRAEGILQLDFRVENECEIVFFGVTPQMVGTGAARFLMNRALETAFRKPISRLWLHTCTHDHPRALDFYRRTGFSPYATKVEIFDDPRLNGILPRSAAPQIPILE